ncbi:ABC transporter ATP-binding protein [Nocardioides sp.]|uniref:ABC transporter ATP-binding protein n=1 Tax=Nocardioides sp. TaxID=35761 RepID=UPI0035299BAF
MFDGLDWTVSQGCTTLLLGPNGAGKSTLLKLLAGLERPRAGRVTVNGTSGRSDLFELVGWMPQDVRPIRGLTVQEQVEYGAWVTGASRRDCRSRARTAIEAVDLTDLSSRRAGELSGGQLRRLGLAQTLARRAHVLLLDEPTAGLDPAQSALFREVLRGLTMPGGIVVSTHQVDELADDVDRVAVLDAGRFRFDGAVTDFREGHPEGLSLAAAFAAMLGRGEH